MIKIRKNVLNIIVLLVLLLTPSILMTGCLNTDVLPFKGDTAYEVPSIEQIEIFNNNGISVTTKSLRYDKLRGYQLLVDVWNNSSNTIALRAESSSINGFMIGNTSSGSIIPGLRAEVAFEFIPIEIKRSNIETILDIEFKLAVYNMEGWSKIAESDLISLKTSEYGNSIQPVNDNGDTVYELSKVYTDENGDEHTKLYFKIVDQGVYSIDTDNSIPVIQSYSPAKENTKDVPIPVIQLYLQNDSDRELIVQMYKAKVNGIEVDTSFAFSIMPGKKAVAHIVYDKNDLEAKGTSVFDTVSYRLLIHDKNGKLDEMKEEIVHHLPILAVD